MINIALTIILIAIFALIFWQDTKDRYVYWFLYPLAGIITFAIQGTKTTYAQAFFNALLNLFLVLLIVIVVWLYSVIILKKKFVNESLGLGDILLFIFLCFSFSPTTFITLFVFSLIFSLLLHQYFKNKSHNSTVPLAGYMALFFATVYLLSFFIAPKYLFA